ncbi:hypothetical protein BOX15_Mlig012688g7, partial [Macrostomum lignano]
TSSMASTRHRGGGANASFNDSGTTSPDSAAKKPSLSETFARSLRPKADWSSKDELLDVVYWQRQLLSAVLGLVWGLLPLKGIVGLGLFFLINCAAVYAYTCLFQGVDEEEYGGMGEILKEGLMTSFASFLVLWIIVYDHCHAGDGSGLSGVESGI